jgi:antitoxin HigA-1
LTQLKIVVYLAAMIRSSQGVSRHSPKIETRVLLRRRIAAKHLRKQLSPVHPGRALREEVLPGLGKTKTEIAKLLGISRQTLFDILTERQPITPAMALRFGKLLGSGPDIWIDLQRAYDLHLAEKQLGRKLARIPTLKAA